MKKFKAHAIVEITLPDVADVNGVDVEMLGDRMRSISIDLAIELKDVVLRLSPVMQGQIGGLMKAANNGGQLITIKNLRLRGIQGEMLPVYDADKGAMVFFTNKMAELSADPVADAPTIVGEEDSTAQLRTSSPPPTL